MFRQGHVHVGSPRVILVVGDLMIDVFVLPDLRSSEQLSGLAIRSGGSAANTAAWIAALQHDVAFVGCIGRDVPGRMAAEELREIGVDVHLLVLDDRATGAVLVNITDEGERVMRSARGANMELAPEMIVAAPGRQIEAVHITGYSFLNRHGLSLLAAAASVAADHGALLSLDPSSVGVIRSIGRARLREAIARYRVDVLLPNMEEACALAEVDDVDTAAHDLGTLVTAIALKRGAKGSLAVERGEARAAPTEEVRPMDSTGAGDAFNAAVLKSLVSENSLVEACAYGNEVAGRVIQKLGGRPAPG